MNTRQLSTLPSRPFLALRLRLLNIQPSSPFRLPPQRRRTHVHAFSTSASSEAPGVMLSKANRKYEASKPVAAAQPDLKKELFPSSSPAYRDGNISDFAKQRSSQSSITGGRLSQNAFASATRGSSKAHGLPLNPRSDNPGSRSVHTNSVTSFVKPTSGLQSLLARSDSFKDEPVSSTAPSAAASSIDSIYIGDDDFSDDENLELSFQRPEALPPPSLPRQRPPNTPPVQSYVPSPATSTTQFPWTSSPLEHWHPPPNPQRHVQKRESPEDIQSVPVAAPVAKKRKLPPNFTKKEVEKKVEKKVDLFAGASNSRQYKNTTVKKEIGTKQESNDEDRFVSSKSTATPATKVKPTPAWETTPGALQAKKNQLRNQSKIKSESQTDLSMEEIRQATADHHATLHKVSHSAMSLSAEQQQVHELVVDKGQSVFFTGPAGTGKSILMRAIVASLKRKWARDPERVSITASTGLAACHIGGQTLHSFSGIGLGKEDVPTLVKKIRRNAKAKNRWLKTRVLIMDEVSMVDGDLFDKLDQIARQIRNNGRPWGGIQLVITGDFFQLPPVPDRNKRDTKFAFDAATWSTSIDHTIGLTQVFRQKDHEFAEMLNEMRLGRVSEQTVQTFRSLSRPLVYDDGITATELFPTRGEVESSNSMRLRALPGEIRTFAAQDSGDPNIRDKLLENMMAPKTIDLKKGAQVMLIKNLDDTLVNGTLGKVIGFSSEAFFTANPSKFDLSVADLVDESMKKIKSFAVRDSSLKDLTEYPVVEFHAADGSFRVMHVTPEEWKVELPNGEVQAKRTALPMILAWALSIHKAQGQTLERVKVDLGKIFEKGQAYVALSRATSKDGLEVQRFDKSKVMAHPKVIQFYNKLYSPDSIVQKKKKPATISDFAHKGKSQSSIKARKQAIELDDEEEAMAYYA
ncbi:hypothetical protein PFICI_14541 [Pestalotiopsis fici W106-1]|uniref:ATP-dependent DNA helicase PIF1 n=1 Tax=Pestalotiopsis fici (strain W106-1 / CGMCC3.15140) TaxID=1229662 RepID=W3WI34_PESFW|nr:uncharacterized protein PFICI_14541 [Pestalotiopsis fici W106-1]ETS73595.1 hypothetical protein PFICI_14541 [Pestalotiopsis fici W106-1]